MSEVKVNYNEMIMNSFWNKCRPHPPHTIARVRRVLDWTARELVDPKTTPENFSDEDCREILDALQCKNRGRVQKLVLEAMRKVKEKN
jgi:hypothetical protein